MGCGCGGGRAKARSLGRSTPAPTAPAAVTKYEVLVQGTPHRFDTLLEARRYRNEHGGTLRTVSA